MAIFLFVTTNFFPQFLEWNNPLWFFVFTILIDVAHVWGTIFRGYLRSEFTPGQKKILIFAPIVAFLSLFLVTHIQITGQEWYFMGVVLLAYMAVFHFIKQQIGFILLYRTREEIPQKLANFHRIFDIIIGYLITLGPFIFWLMHYGEKNINWFIDGEYIFLANFLTNTSLYWIVTFAIILIYILAQILFIFAGARINLLKYIYILGTAFIWYAGMVFYDNMIIFGVGNMLLHGINYYGIVTASTFSNREKLPKILKKFSRSLVSVFMMVAFFLISFAFIETFLFEKLIWQEQISIFGDFGFFTIENKTLLIAIFSLLGSIQLTHYILDRYIWKKDFGKIF